MPRIRSANPDIASNEAPTPDPNYVHGMDVRKSFVPMAFQVTSPIHSKLALLPTALVMHVNPANINMSHQKKVERIQTRGGFVEQHWGDELDDISADGSTGAFINIRTGLSAVMRRRTIAWDRFRDLYDLYRNNGSLHDPYGNIVLQGNIMLMWDRGTYLGYFKQFDFEETDDTPFAFKLSWNFKVQHTILKVAPSLAFGTRAPAFQTQNTIRAQTSRTPGTITAADISQSSNAEIGARLNLDSTIQPPPNPPAIRQANKPKGPVAGPVPAPKVKSASVPTNQGPPPPPSTEPYAIGSTADGRTQFSDGSVR